MPNAHWIHHEIGGIHECELYVAVAKEPPIALLHLRALKTLSMVSNTHVGWVEHNANTYIVSCSKSAQKQVTEFEVS